MTETPAFALPLPLFYRAPEPVSAVRQADWRLRSGDYRFAADTAYVPVVIGEFVAIARHYPILFAAGEAPAPVALLGVEQANLFVTEGAWAEQVHIPAYVRRYPFGYVSTGENDHFALALDTASDRIVRSGDEGQPLFMGGEPSDLTRQALAFCEAFRLDAEATREFCEALVRTELLVERRADVTLPDGAKFGIQGFMVVDGERFAKLDVATVVNWQHRGWLALVHHHLASLDHFQALLARKLARAEKLAA